MFHTHRRMFTLILTLLSLSILTSSAKFEQILLPINENNKKVSFTLFHFDNSKKVTLVDVKNHIGDSVTSIKAEAAVSASIPHLTFKADQLVFTNNTPYFIQDQKLHSSIKSTSKHKHTFILTDKSSQHAIGYASNMSDKELAFAIKYYILSSKVTLTSAVILDSGNQCGFYKHKGQYTPYYLKELKKPAKALIIQ